MTTIIKLRRDTAANWTIANPILAAGEPGLETDTLRIKYGDGSTAWTSLSYQAVGNATYAITAGVANSVDVANVANIGNIGTINLDGNVNNVLKGDGTWAAEAASTYGDSNVAAYLPNYTGNLAGAYLNVSFDVNANVVTGNYLYGDGSNITNLPVGNIASINLDGNVSNLLAGDGSFVAIPFIPVLGNISAVNLDGNVSNVLTGNGTFVELPMSYGNAEVANYLPTYTGDFSSIGNIVASNASPAPYLSGFSSISALSISGEGGNLSNIQVGNVVGLGNIASINLDGNSQTWLAGNGTFANISIPAVGNIATINLDGNVSNLLAGDGTFVAIPVVGNIASINLDGNVSNVLAGDGTFVALPVVGNVGTTNFDGNASNVLLGNGIFSGVPLYPNAVVWSTAPISNTAAGNAGEAAYDSGGNLYICVSTNTWSKFSGTTSW